MHVWPQKSKPHEKGTPGCVRKSCNPWITSLVGPRGGSVKAAGLGDGAMPGQPLSAYEAEKPTIAKLALDAATRVPGYTHRHTPGV